MKTIHTMTDSLAFQLQALYFAEEEIKRELTPCSHHTRSQQLEDELNTYVRSADDKILKLERIFNYLMQEPEARKNKVIIKLLDDTREMLSRTDSAHLRDVLMVSCLQNINAYKISSLKIAYMFAVELELDTAADLVQQVLESELETAKALSRLSIDAFNKSHESITL